MESGGIPVGWLITLVVFVCAIFVIMVVDTVLSRLEARSLQEAAEALEAWPIAVFRYHPRRKIVLCHRIEDPGSAFVLLDGDTREPISPQAIWSLFNKGRLRWYKSGLHPLGLRMFLWYRDAHPGAIDWVDPATIQAPRWLVILVLSSCALFVGFVAVAMILNL